MRYKLMIIGILLAGFGIIGSTVYLGYAVRDEQVVADAYDAGLQYDAVQRNDARLGWQFWMPRTVSLTKNVLTVRLTNKDGRPLTDATVNLKLNRLGTRTDRSYRCTNAGGGLYRSPLTVEQTGYWSVQVTASRAKDSYIHDDEIDVVR